MDQFTPSILNLNDVPFRYLDGVKDGMWFATNLLLNGIVNCEKTVVTPIGKFFTTVSCVRLLGCCSQI